MREKMREEEMHEQGIHEQEASNGQDIAQPDPGKYLFVLHPCGRDFDRLAQHIATAPQEALHSALWPQRAGVAQSLRHMAQEPEQTANQAAYHALRLLAW